MSTTLYFLSLSPLKAAYFGFDKTQDFYIQGWHHEMGQKHLVGVEWSRHFVQGDGSCKREAKKQLWGGSEQFLFSGYAELIIQA